MGNEDTWSPQISDAYVLSFVLQADPPPPYEKRPNSGGEVKGDVVSSIKKTLGQGLKRLPSVKRKDNKDGVPEPVLASRLQRAKSRKVIKEDLETGDIVVCEESTADAGLTGMFKKSRKIRK